MQHLLLLHGALGSKVQMQSLVPALEKNYIVHTLNFSGHGGEPLPTHFTIDIFANDVLVYLEKKQIHHIDIFGYSMGGYVALYLAKKHPEKINKIFTLATKFAWTPEISQKEIKMLNAEKIIEKIPAFASVLEKRHLPNDWKEMLSKTKDMMIALGDVNTLKLSDFETIQHTVTLGIGDDDNMVTISETKDVCQKLKNGHLVILPDTKHPIEQVNIEQLSTELKQFFSS